MKRQFPLSAHVKSARRTIDACVVVGGDLFNVPEVSEALRAASERGVDIRLLFPWHNSPWLGDMVARVHATTNYAAFVRMASDKAAAMLPRAELRWYDAPGPCWFVTVDGSTMFTKPFDVSRQTFPVEEDRPEQIEHYCRLFDQIWELSLTEPSDRWPNPGTERRVQVVSITPSLLAYLARRPERMRELSADAFEQLVAERLDAMGFWVHRLGQVNTPDGGIDLIACPQRNAAFPYVVAVQVKHSHVGSSVGPPVIRELRDAMGPNVDVGLVVTNTRFTEPARIAASDEFRRRIRLRDMTDLARWLIDDFTGEARFSDVPREVHIAPGLRIAVPRQGVMLGRA
jgi:hypothetical protein